MNFDLGIIIVLLAFLSVAGVVIVLGRLLADRTSVNRRLNVDVPSSSAIFGREQPTWLGGFVKKIDERKFGFEGTLRTKLRRDLVRAGYFSDDAMRIYIFSRLAAVVVFPLATYAIIAVVSPDTKFYLRMLAVAIATGIGLIGVDFYVARRKRLLQADNRAIFPDLIDMLVVCVDAGLSLDAALARIGPEIARRSRVLGTNIAILGAETRAGRSLPQALASFADRLDLDEVRSFAVLLRQSFELGTDVADALRVFSDEMRGKRLLRAEEMANKLPVKMVLPLGACIFPVILLVVMVPVVIRLLSMFQQVGHH
jgi:tight adherence protein C